MQLAHEGEDHTTDNHTETPATTSEHSAHVGHVQSSSTNQGPTTFGRDTQGLFIGGGVALLILAAGMIAWLIRDNKKPAPVTVDNTSD